MFLSPVFGPDLNTTIESRAAKKIRDDGTHRPLSVPRDCSSAVKMAVAGAGLNIASYCIILSRPGVFPFQSEACGCELAWIGGPPWTHMNTFSIISTVQLASAEADFASFTNYTPNLICTMPKQQTKREFPPPTFPTNPEVAQQLSDLLQCFPAAAIGGVQWKTLLQSTRRDQGFRGIWDLPIWDFYWPLRQLVKMCSKTCFWQTRWKFHAVGQEGCKSKSKAQQLLSYCNAFSGISVESLWNLCGFESNQIWIPNVDPTVPVIAFSLLFRFTNVQHGVVRSRTVQGNP